MRRLLPFTLATLLLTFVTAVSANAQSIPAEDDTWITAGGTQVDFSQFGSVNLVQVLGGQPNNTVVSFVGSPLSSSLGLADTLVARASFTIPSIGSTTSPQVSLQGLSLESSPDLVVTKDGGMQVTYHVIVSLATQGDSGGTIALTTTTSEGGTFHSHFSVTPLFTFKNVQNSMDVHTVDCSDSTLACKFAITGDGNWVQTSSTGFDPQSFGIPIVPSGVQIGTYTTVGRPRFGGIQVGCGGTHSSGYGCGQNNELHGEGSVGQALHGAKPANDCAAPPPPSSPSSVPATRASAATGNATSQSGGPSPTPVLCTATPVTFTH